jgi:hypothetical protein
MRSFSGLRVAAILAAGLFVSGAASHMAIAGSSAASASGLLNDGVYHQPDNRQMTYAPWAHRALRLQHHAAWYIDGNGVMMGDTCQTQVNWCKNGLFYPVGQACHCGYAFGVIAQE